jgi:uncharacterized protein YabN with tetrapyrrole methylase and pyrophosphatase domain
MNDEIKNAYRKVINKHHAMVQTDTLLEHTDNWKLEKKARQFGADFSAAEAEFLALLEKTEMNRDNKAIWNAAIEAVTTRLRADFYAPDVIIGLIEKDIKK